MLLLLLLLENLSSQVFLGKSLVSNKQIPATIHLGDFYTELPMSEAV